MTNAGKGQPDNAGNAEQNMKTAARAMTESKNRHSCESRPVIPAKASPSFLRKQARHSCESRNPEDGID